MSKALGTFISAYIKPDTAKRLNNAVMMTNAKTRSRLIEDIITAWLEKNGF